MLRYLEHNKIDAAKWDACIDKAVNAIPYAYSWYLDIVTNKSWAAIVLDDYKAVFPVPLKSYVLFKKVYQPFFVQQLGLFARDKKHFSALPDCLLLLEQKQKKIYLHLNTQNHLGDASKRITHHLALQSGYETLYKNYGSTVKKNLKMLKNKGVQVSSEVTIPEFISFIKKHVGDKVSELKQKDFKTLEQLVRECVKREKGFLRCTKNKVGDILSTVFFLHSNHFLIYLVAGSSPEGRKLQSMTFLLDSMIQHYANTNTTLDFEGSMIPGIANFYKSFGGMEISYPVLK